MERIITVMNSKTQKKSVFKSNATTLGELKAEFRKNNIDYSDLEIIEGITKTQFYSDDSMLPHDIDYKGEKTNNLIILLTNTKKKIKSGVSRTELYARLTPEMKEHIKSETGKNFTNASSEYLNSVIQNFSVSPISIPDVEEDENIIPERNCACEKLTEDPLSGLTSTIISVIREGVKVLQKTDILSKDQATQIYFIINSIPCDIFREEGTEEDTQVKSPYSDDELEDIMDSIDSFLCE